MDPMYDSSDGEGDDEVHAGDPPASAAFFVALTAAAGAPAPAAAAAAPSKPETAEEKRERGNDFFRQQDYKRAAELYSEVAGAAACTGAC